MSAAFETALEVMREEIRNEALAEAARKLLDFHHARCLEYGPYDQGVAALWNSAWYLVDEMGDGNLRRERTP